MTFADRLFPYPNPGAERMIPSRHPVQIGLLAGFIVSSVFQATAGPVLGSLGAVINWPLWVTLLIAAVIGCLLCLVAAIIAEKKPWDAMGFSLGGFFILTFVLLVGCYGYWVGYPGEFLGKREFWVNLFIALGFIWRFCQLSRRAIGLWRHHDRLEDVTDIGGVSR